MSGESDPNGKGLHEPGAKAHAVHGLRGGVRQSPLVVWIR